MLLDDLSQRSGQQDDLNAFKSPRILIHVNPRIDHILILTLEFMGRSADPSPYTTYIFHNNK